MCRHNWQHVNGTTDRCVRCGVGRGRLAAERDRARDVAVALEQENEALRRALEMDVDLRHTEAIGSLDDLLAALNPEETPC